MYAHVKDGVTLGSYIEDNCVHVTVKVDETLMSHTKARTHMMALLSSLVIG